eukprot:7024073-Alexandrium_andersonii.AAC.1
MSSGTECLRAKETRMSTTKTAGARNLFNMRLEPATKPLKHHIHGEAFFCEATVAADTAKQRQEILQLLEQERSRVAPSNCGGHPAGLSLPTEPNSSRKQGCRRRRGGK